MARTLVPSVLAVIAEVTELAATPGSLPSVQRPPIDAVTLRAALGPTWARVDVVDEVGSTNAELLADTQAPHGSVLVAEHQHSGRGRLDRSWSSPPCAGLLFSVLLRPVPAMSSWGWLPLLTGLAVHDAVRDTCGVDVALKWPNDLLHAPSDRKLAGILAQTAGKAVVVGVGLNVSTTATELPLDTASSLMLSGATKLDRVVLLAAILAELERRTAAWTSTAGADPALATDYRAACSTVGREVVVSRADGGVLVGTAVGVDDDGRLQIEQHGHVTVVAAGDVHHVRPPGMPS